MPWDWRVLAENPNITGDIIAKNGEKEWDFNSVSRNQNIKFELVENNPDKEWDMFHLSINQFIPEKEEFMIREYRKYLAAYKIQLMWRKCRYDPSYKMCERVLLNNLKEIENEYT